MKGRTTDAAEEVMVEIESPNTGAAFLNYG
jgi:hypothetical protein